MSSKSIPFVEPNAVQMLEKLWPRVPTDMLESIEYSRLLSFVRTRLKSLTFHTTASHSVTPDDLAWIIHHIRQSSASSRRELFQTIKTHVAHRNIMDDAISKGIDMAAGLWLTLKIRSPTYSLLSSGRIIPDPTILTWADDDSLSTIVARHFDVTGIEANKDLKLSRINNDLTMANLIRNYQFRVYWTDNLAEHLAIDRNSNTVTIYEHKICLSNHLRFQDQTVLPISLVKEAIDTINLLFPFDHAPTEALLHKHKIPFYGLGYCGRPRMLELNNYSYWRDRVEELHRVLDEPPVGLNQLGLDRGRKNLLQFATFWIATAVAILTIISFVIGVYSAVYTKKQYDLALLQYQLSLAQACATSGAGDQLPAFCS